MILAGDVGGTKCNLALIEQHDRAFETIFLQRYPSRDYADFTAVLDHFLRDTLAIREKSAAGKVDAAGFGVAGPVIGERAHLTNLGWTLERAIIERQLGTPHVALLNDLEATGYCLPWLSPDQLCALNVGKPSPQAPCALIAAGTGLGEAMLRWSGGRYVVDASEGGHCDLAPRTEREIELLRYMKRSSGQGRFEPVSFEMVLSGRGFLTVHQFLDPAVWHPGFEHSNSAAPEITRLGLAGSCPVCVQTLDLWTMLYGAEAGNLALKTLARGGVYVAGGIAPKILPKMKDGTFLRTFCEKSKFGELLSQIPVAVVLDEKAPLLGAASEAARMLSQQSP